MFLRFILSLLSAFDKICKATKNQLYTRDSVKEHIFYAQRYDQKRFIRYVSLILHASLQLLLLI